MASTALAGLVVLMIGDSHLAYPNTLVTTLQDLLVSQGAQVTSYGACGAQATAWAMGGIAPCGFAERTQRGAIQMNHSPASPVPRVASLIGTVHPNMIIVTLGDTIAQYTQPTMIMPEFQRDVGSLTAQLRAINVPCIWVGPGWGTEGGPFFKTFARAKQVSDLLASSVSPCQYVDSTRLAQPGEWGTSDGVHYTVPGYQKWAFAIDAAVLRLAQH